MQIKLTVLEVGVLLANEFDFVTLKWLDIEGNSVSLISL